MKSGKHEGTADLSILSDDSFLLFQPDMEIYRASLQTVI